MVTSRPRSQSSAHELESIRVVVVDDHPIFRRGLVDTLHAERGLTVCAETGSIAEARAAIATEHPDVAVVDLSLGDEDGLDLVAMVADEFPSVRVLVLSGHDERVHADRALRAGALGYVMKDQAATDLVDAIRRVASGRPAVSQETADRILSAMGSARRKVNSPLERLSDRERQVLTLMGKGSGTRQIAQRLDVSVKTVESHYAHIKEKLGILNGRELMRVAVTWAEGRPV